MRRSGSDHGRVRQLLISYLVATAAALCLFVFSVLWQAVNASVRRWQGPASAPAAPSTRHSGVPGGGEHPPEVRDQAA